MTFTDYPVYENVSCDDMYDLVNTTATNSSLFYCYFIQHVDSCQLDSGFFQYNNFVFCYFDKPLLAMLILLVWLTILLITIATTADSFFGPCLIVVTKLTGMSQNLAGVTLLAFGNGAADIFSSITAVNSLETSDAGLVFGALLGAGLLVNCVTGGGTMIIKPFTCARRPVLKDLAFYLVAICWIFTILWKGRIYTGEAIGFICLYVVYVVITVSARAIYAKQGIKRVILVEETTPSTVRIHTVNSVNNAIPEIVIESDLEPREIALPSLASDGQKGFLGIPSHLYRADQRPRAQTDDRFYQATLRPQAVAKGDENIKLRKRRKISTSSSNRAYLARWLVANIDGLEEEGEQSRKRVSSSSNGSAPKQRHHSEGGERSKLPSTTSENGRRHSRYSELVHSLPTNGGFLLPQACDMSPCSLQGEVNRHLNEGSSSLAQASMEVNDVSYENVGFTQQDEGDNDTEVMQSSDAYAVDDTISETGKTEEYVYPGMWRNLMEQLNPIDVEEWPTMSPVSKVLEIFKAPILLIIRIFTPVVVDEDPIKAWCKLLNTAQCILTPVYWLVATQKYDVDIGGGFPLIVLVILIGVALAITVWFTSTPEKPPAYHGAFAVTGFVTSIIWIYIVANEVVNILKTVGLTFRISQAILGLTLLAFANSVGDMMSNLVLAKNNYPQIAFSACVGGPLFNCLLGIGLPFTFKCIANGGSFEIEPSLVQFVIPGFLIFTLLYEIIAIPCLGFHLRPLFGVSLICIYVIFMIVAILCEVGALHLPQR